MFAKLTSNRFLRQMHSGVRPERALLVAPTHANDNQRLAGAAARPRLACRWVPLATGGLECRWHIVPDQAARADEPGRTACGHDPAVSGGPHLALVGG
jgi:hypothetical protein